MSDIIRSGQQGALPIVDPRLRAITDRTLQQQAHQQDPGAWYDRMRSDFGMTPVGSPEPEDDSKKFPNRLWGTSDGVEVRAPLHSMNNGESPIIGYVKHPYPSLPAHAGVGQGVPIYGPTDDDVATIVYANQRGVRYGVDGQSPADAANSVAESEFPGVLDTSDQSPRHDQSVSDDAAIGTHTNLEPASLDQPLSQAGYAGLDTVDPVDVGEMDMPAGDKGQFAEISAIPTEQIRQVVRPGRPGPALPRDAAEGRPAVAKAPAPKQAKPLDAALVRPVALNAGPEDAAGPLPDEAAPRAPLDEDKAMDPIGRIWTRWNKVAMQNGMSKQDFYDAALNAYRSGKDHLDGMAKVNTLLVKDMRVDRDTAARNEVQQRAVQDAHARRLGMTMPVYQFYQGSLQSGMPPDEAMLAAAHAMNPYAGWGNLLALTRKQRADQEQAELALKKDNPAAPMEKIKQAIDSVVTGPASPATLSSLRMIYLGMPGNQADKKGADQFALDNAASMYAGLHGQANIGPQQQQFVRQYINSFPTYDEFIAHNRLEDTPANQRIWTAITKRPVKTGFQRGMDALGNAVAAGANAVGGFLGGQQPAPDQQANAGGRRPFD